MPANNSCHFIGNFTRDPEVREVGDSKVARFSLGVNGFKKGEVQFPEFEAWGKQAEIVEKYCTKGSSIAVDAQFKNDSWEDKETGQKRYRTKFRVSELTLLSSKNGGGAAAKEEEAEEAAAPEPAKPTKAGKKPARKAPEPEADEDDDESDLPF